jgi:hypothetical protein
MQPKPLSAHPPISSPVRVRAAGNYFTCRFAADASRDKLWSPRLPRLPASDAKTSTLPATTPVTARSACKRNHHPFCHHTCLCRFLDVLEKVMRLARERDEAGPRASNDGDEEDDEFLVLSDDDLDNAGDPTSPGMAVCIKTLLRVTRAIAWLDARDVRLRSLGAPAPPPLQARQAREVVSPPSTPRQATPAATATPTALVAVPYRARACPAPAMRRRLERAAMLRASQRRRARRRRKRKRTLALSW